jgi:hypothetical protein
MRQLGIMRAQHEHFYTYNHIGCITVK